MAAKKKNKQPVEPYLNPPSVQDIPQDFDYAAKLNMEAGHAINYWKDQQRYAMFSDRKFFAKDKLKAWGRVSDACQTVMASFQLKLF